MTDRDTGLTFDHDPNLDKPFRLETRRFLQAYRTSNEFRFRYGGNLSLSDDLDRLT